MEPRFTRADYNRLPEGFPAQLIGGRLVKKDPKSLAHQLLLGRMLLGLYPLAGDGYTAPGPLEVGTDDWNVFQPDVLVLKKIPRDDATDVGIPLIAVEVLSPPSAKLDRGVKRRRLIAAGTNEVWIVDPAAQSVEVYDAAGCRTAKGDTEIASVALPGFRVVPSVLFKDTQLPWAQARFPTFS